MEDLSRDLAKVVKEYTPPKPSKRANSWSVLFLGDRGNIISIKKPRSVIIILAVIFFISMASSFCLLIISKRTIEENRSLSKALNISRKEAVSLRDEKDLLMVRLVVAEAKIKGADADISPDSTPSAQTKISKAIVKTPSLSDKKQVEEKKAPVLPEKVQKTVVEDFVVLFEQDTDMLNVRFKIINVSKGEEPVSGHAFVILKQNEDDQSSWRIFPSAPLSSGKPARFEKGQYFSILRFKIIKFKTQNETDPKRFKTAEIFVFSTKGELLLEKSFPVEIKEPVSEEI